MTEGRTLSARMSALLLGVAVVAALGLGGALGARLGARASRADARELAIVDPGSVEATQGAGARSTGGFSGFGGQPALQGDVLRHGLATEVARGSLTLVDGAARTAVEYEQPLRLFRIGPAGAPAALGDTAVVNVDGTRATGVLLTRTSADTRVTPAR